MKTPDELMIPNLQIQGTITKVLSQCQLTSSNCWKRQDKRQEQMQNTKMILSQIWH